MTILAPGVTDLLALARHYAADPDAWPLAPRFDPARRWYTRLVRADDHEVWLLTWLPGQATELHDHGSAAGAFAVVGGELTEQTVTDRAAARFATRVVPAGTARGFGPDYTHRLVNAGTRPAVSVHAYAPTLRTMTTYEIAGGAVRPVAVSQAGLDW